MGSKPSTAPGSISWPAEGEGWLEQRVAIHGDLKDQLAELDRMRRTSLYSAAAAEELVTVVGRRVWELFNGAGLTLPAAALVLPVMLERLGPQRRFERDWRRIRRRAATLWARDHAAIPDVLLLFCDAMCEGVGAALARHIARLATGPLGALDMSAAARLGGRLGGTGWFDRVDPAVPAAIRRSLVVGREPDAEFALRTYLIAALGFVKAAPVEWLHMLFEELVLPTIERALERDRHDVALELEQRVHAAYLERVPTIEHQRKCYRRLLPALAAAGHKQRARLPPISMHPFMGPPRVAFFLHNASRLAHVRVVLSLLQGLRGIQPRPFSPLLYVLEGEDEQFATEAARLEVPVVSFSPGHDHSVPRLAKLLAIRERAAADGLTAIVFVSASLHMSYAFALRMAPVQILWSMNFHTISSDDIDGYLTGGLFEQWRDIDGRRWRVLQIGLPDMFRPQHAARAQELRQRHGADRGMVILGWMGREEKIANRPFVTALARILAQVPQAVFLWTGRSESPEFLDLLDEFGIRSRCPFIGWVDTQLYAQVFDIYVDGFPSVSGHTAFDAMAAGVPVVVLITPESLATGMPKNVYRIYAGMVGTAEQQAEVRALFTSADGEDLTGFAKDVDQFVQRTTQLALDPAMRRRVGEAGRTFMRRYVCDVDALARTGSKHIMDIIAERKG